ncbi:MAG: hypothetical protein Q9227_004906 [Pyrenula ochraceoflavens]
MAEREVVSETSPLLNGHQNGLSKKHTNGSIENESVEDSTPSVGSDLERQDSREAGRDAQFAGMPEMRERLKYIVPTLSIGIFLAATDQTIIVASYGKIGSELHALQLTSWIATCYFLTLTSFQPLYGKLSDIFGRKPCLLTAYGIFGIGCLLCGIAQDIKQLIAARLFQGVGAGGLTTIVSILMSDIVPLKERGVWQGIINIVFATGAACGAPLGGAFADYASWRLAFLFQAPLCLIAFVVVTLFLKLPKADEGHWKDKLRRVDFLGAFFLVAAVFCMLLGLDRGSNVAWSEPISYVSLAVSVILTGTFILVEIKYAAEPFAPGHIIFNMDLFPAYLCNFFSFAALMSVLYYLPLYFQAVNRDPATEAGFRLLPATVSGVCGSLFGGWYMKKTGKYYWITSSFYSVMMLSLVFIILFTGVLNNSYPLLAVAMVFCFFVRNAPPKDQAVATACSYLFRSLGSVVGVSLTATVVQQSLRAYLEDALKHGEDAERIVAGVRESLDFIKTLQPAVAELVRHSYSLAMRNGFGLIAGLSFFSAFAAFWITEKRLE